MNQITHVPSPERVIQSEKNGTGQNLAMMAEKKSVVGTKDILSKFIMPGHVKVRPVPGRMLQQRPA